MTRQLDIEQLLDAWLDEGPTDTADAVFDAAVARVYRQRQWPAWRFLRREPNVTTPIKLLLAAAAVIVVAVVGGTYLLGERAPVGNVPSPTPSATPTASPSTVLSGGAEFPSWFPNRSPAPRITSSIKLRRSPRSRNCLSTTQSSWAREPALDA